MVWLVGLHEAYRTLFASRSYLPEAAPVQDPDRPEQMRKGIGDNLADAFTHSEPTRVCMHGFCCEAQPLVRRQQGVSDLNLVRSIIKSKSSETADQSGRMDVGSDDVAMPGRHAWLFIARVEKQLEYVRFPMLGRPAGIHVQAQYRAKAVWSGELGF